MKREGAGSELSIVIPAKNEASPLRELLGDLADAFPQAEVIVVDDGSTDDTRAVCEALRAHCVRHPASLGNGAAVKAGARRATREWIAFMDGDGQHTADALRDLYLEFAGSDYAMLVGARKARGHASMARLTANGMYNGLASVVTGQRIRDLTSGLRITTRRTFNRYLALLPNGFSYPTTITMAYLRSGHAVGYRSVIVEQRVGRSHIRPLRDGLRFLLIIFKVGTLYSPLKIFAPISALFGAAGMANYVWTYITQSRFTNMSALLLSVSVLVFVIGLLSEQITQLIYLAINREPEVSPAAEQSRRRSRE